MNAGGSRHAHSSESKSEAETTDCASTLARGSRWKPKNAQDAHLPAPDLWACPSPGPDNPGRQGQRPVSAAVLQRARRESVYISGRRKETHVWLRRDALVGALMTGRSCLQGTGVSSTFGKCLKQEVLASRKELQSLIGGFIATDVSTAASPRVASPTWVSWGAWWWGRPVPG